jgi:hypothetical protein
MMKRPNSSEEPLKGLLQESGLVQPSAQFSSSLTRLVVARYSSSAVRYRADAWLGNLILAVLTGGLLFVILAMPAVFLSVVGISLLALLIGIGGIIWLLEQHRSHLLPVQREGSL